MDKSKAKQYAQQHNLYIIALYKDTHSGDEVAIAVKKCLGYANITYYTFGHLYHVFGDEFVYDQCGCAHFHNFTDAKDEAFQFFGYLPVAKKEDVKELADKQLSGFPWGGEVIDVHTNKYGEWIADCHVWGQYGRDPYDPDWVYYKDGDLKCPVRQFMVKINYYYKINSTNGQPEDIHWSASLWDAKDDKRLPTFTEECPACIDEHAPDSPYITEPIREKIRDKFKYPELYPSPF